jgi:hypothetical protein
MAPGQNFRIGIRAAAGEPFPRWSVAQEDASQGLEGHWPLEVKPGNGFTGLDLLVREQKGKMPLSLVETLERKILPLGQAPVHLSAQELEQGDYHVVAGNPEYVAAFLSQMAGGAYHLRLVNFPNPFTAFTSIRYSLPASFQSVEYRVRIFDFRGKEIWEKTWNGTASLNTAWEGRDRHGRMAPAGQYHLLVEAKVPGRPAFRAQRKLIKLGQ